MWPSSGEEGLDVGLNVGSAVKGGRNVQTQDQILDYVYTLYTVGKGKGEEEREGEEKGGGEKGGEEGVEGEKCKEKGERRRRRGGRRGKRRRRRRRRGGRRLLAPWKLVF